MARQAIRQRLLPRCAARPCLRAGVPRHAAASDGASEGGAVRRARGRPAGRRLVLAGYAIAVPAALYAPVLGIGLATLPAPDQPIQDPWFTIMELLILAIAPALVLFALGLRDRVPAGNRAAAQGAVLAMALCAGVTVLVHLSILVVARWPAVQAQAWAPAVFDFRWPSLAYALDILAWDLLFAIGAGCCALALRGVEALRFERRLLGLAALLALAGLAGVPLADMTVRNIGILGYAVVFPVAAARVARKAAALPA